ncbi:hypothetical protein FOZ60_012254 [Perkinsus olseni]|uniref:SWIM-type domain-containing protein n=1 Tax=Perkinsus olseni TaxID=32597 RepID=A0A7J6NBR5_PEROL|nr:hypothetical protein FOZ60_012254 [Perkinsus olseni]
MSFGVCPLALVLADEVYAKAPLFNNVCEGTFSTLRTFTGKKPAKVGGVAGMINLTRMFLVGYGDVGASAGCARQRHSICRDRSSSMRKKAEDRLGLAERSTDICREVDIGVERVALSLGLPCQIGSVEEFREKILQVNVVVTCTEDSKNFHCGATICSCGTFNKLFTCSHVALVSTVIACEAGRGTSGMDIRLPTVTWGGRPTGTRGPLVRTKTDVVAQGQAKGQGSTSTPTYSRQSVERDEHCELMAEIATPAAAGTFRSPQVKRAGQGEVNNAVAEAAANLGMIEDGQGEESKTVGKGAASPGMMGSRRSKASTRSVKEESHPAIVAL